LYGFVTAVGEVQLNQQEIRGQLAQVLPAYMVPLRLVQLEKFPLTVNGKIDQVQLLLLANEQQNHVPYVAPTTSTEISLTTIWSDVLKLDKAKLGMRENFFDLGGHSLMAVQVISRVRQDFAIDIPLSAIFEVSTIGEMAKYIDASAWIRDENLSAVESKGGEDREEIEL
jgi:acyl carrier protein